MPDHPAILCPGQGAQKVGMGRAWAESSPAARAVFDEADAVLGERLGAPLSTLCFEGPPERLNRTDVAQPAIYACSVACFRGLNEQAPLEPAAAAGLSLGEYTALHLAGALAFVDGLELVALRGSLMQEASESSAGGMVALVGADEEQARALCEAAPGPGEVLVPANFNAPGQIVLSGDRSACDRAVELAGERGLRATALAVAGAFHSPHMQPAADRLGQAMARTTLQPLQRPVWSNVTASPHPPDDLELLRRRLVEQVVSPVRWSQSCQGMVSAGYTGFDEMAPGSVLRGLMRRIDRNAKVRSHEEP